MSAMTPRAAIAGFAILVVAVLGSASAASNSVAPSAVSQHSEPITANSLAPAICSHLSLTNIVTGAGIISGTLGNDLILGSAGGDSIDAIAGNNCTLAGGGDDIILGGLGNDVIDGGEGFDTCDGGGGSNTLYRCEL